MTMELEDRLRRDLPRLADVLEDAASPPGATGAPAAIDGLEPERPRWGHPLRLAVAAGLVVLLGLAGLVVLVRAHGRDQLTTSVTAEPRRPLDTWGALPSGPLSPREDAPSVWTGKEWMIFGGRQGLLALDDSVAYDPTTNTWRSLAVNPTMHPGAQPVWTGHVVAVLAKGGGWIYDPGADTWTALPRQSDQPSESVVSNDAVWTGHEVVAIGVTVTNGHGALGARSLDPTTRRWGALVQTAPLAPDLSVMGAVAGARWDGSRVQVWLTTGAGWAYDPGSQTWQALAPLEVPGTNTETTYSVAGSGSVTYVLVHTADTTGSSSQLAAFSDGTWRLVGPPQPGPDGDAGPLLTMAGDQLVVFSRQQAPETIDPSTGATRALPTPLVGPGSGRTVTWTGQALLVFGGRNTQASTGGNPGADGALTATAAELTASRH